MNVYLKKNWRRKNYEKLKDDWKHFFFLAFLDLTDRLKLFIEQCCYFIVIKSSDPTEE